jgi:hydroxypyruvate reductase
MIRLADERTLLLCLLSGGGSALMVLPVDGVSLADKQAVSRLLLESGATIHEVNTIRKHLSRIKGGGLARLAGKAQVVTLILSDVIGDDPGIIASGPTCQDETTYLDCLRILGKFSLWPKLPQAVRQYFTKLQTNAAPASDKPDTGSVAQHLIIGSNSLALEAAAAKAITLGYQPVILTSRLQGEAREVAKVLTAIIQETRQSGHPVAPPVCLLAGGETTVSLRGKGKGGRNMELALAAVEPLAGLANVVLLSAGTDGTDGPTDAAGAIVADRKSTRLNSSHNSESRMPSSA